MLKQRVITALILLFVVLGALFAAPPWVWGALSLLAMAVAGYEWAMLIGTDERPAPTRYLLPAVLVVAGIAYLAWRGESAPPPVPVLVLLAVDLLAWVLVVVPSLVRARPLARNLAFAALCLFSLFVALYELRLVHPLNVFTAMGVIWLADIGAYFAGRAFGKRKLAPRISPGKSWEGAVGGALLAVACAALAWSVWPDTRVFSNHVAVSGAPLLMLAVVALLCALSVTGDLYESLMKRARGVKDSGTIFPGHGGLLDRIDAMVPTLPVAALLWSLTAASAGYH